MQPGPGRPGRGTLGGRGGCGGGLEAGRPQEEEEEPELEAEEAVQQPTQEYLRPRRQGQVQRQPDRQLQDRVQEDQRLRGRYFTNIPQLFYRDFNGLMCASADFAGDKNIERVLSWKFQSLDKDADGYLDRAEYKELRRLAKKAVRPKKCARTFARTCDLDRDLKLSRTEWGACLANDFTREFLIILHW